MGGMGKAAKWRRSSLVRMNTEEESTHLLSKRSRGDKSPLLEKEREKQVIF